MQFPTSKDDLVFTATKSFKILRRKEYLLFSLVFSFLSLSIFVLPGNLSIVIDLVIFGELSLSDRIILLLDFYPFFSGTFLNSFLLIITSFLVGINISIIVYGYLNGDVVSSKGGVVGSFLGMLGAGCAACGSALLATVFSVSSVASTLSILPLHGSEILILSIIILSISIFWAVESVSQKCPL